LVTLIGKIYAVVVAIFGDVHLDVVRHAGPRDYVADCGYLECDRESKLIGRGTGIVGGATPCIPMRLLLSLGFFALLLFAVLMYDDNPKMVVQVVLVVVVCIVGHLTNGWRARQREAGWFDLGRSVGAELSSNPADCLARFADNPWRSWPKDDDDIIAEFALRSDKRGSEFYVLEISFNKISRDDAVYPFTVTFVIVRLNSVLAGRHLQQVTIPERFAAFVGGNYLYLYRTRSRAYPGGKLALADISDVIVRARTLAARLDALG
jgi:hypothetical protein